MLEPVLAQQGVLRPTHVEVYTSQIVANYKMIEAHVGQRKVMAILKANAYGHGLIPIAKAMERIGCPYLGLAYLEEGIQLRRAGITTPILVMGGIIGSQIPLFIEYDLTITASSVDKLRAIEQCAKEQNKKAKVHLKIDTGMERIGIHYYSAEKLLSYSIRCQHVIVEGIFSHFANADSSDPTYTQMQLERFQKVLAFYPRNGLPYPIRHIANSGAIVQTPPSWLDMVRPGILLYGVYPSSSIPQIIPVKLAMRWVSRVVYFKVVKPDHPVSYGSTWKTDRMVRIVTIPVGYGDGYHRRMSGKAKLLINGKKYPVVGRICMDQIMANIEWEEAYNGDEVVLLGQQGENMISVADLAQWADTIPYEILTSINTRVPRIYPERACNKSAQRSS